MRHREGVTDDVNEKMEAVNADVICADGLLLRECEHGVRHPVGNVHSDDITERESQTRHEVRSSIAGTTALSACCVSECCARWLLERVASVSANI
jgi:hypothetical protein